MRICAVSKDLGRVFQAMGHEVVNLWPSGQGVFNLERALADRSFVPDLIFQQETLGPRIVLKGLENFSCLKVFWAIDAHLNLFWQSRYAALFDGIMTPHVSVVRESSLAGKPVGRLAQYGFKGVFRPHSRRTRDLAFVGRLSEHRPARGWLAEFLRENYRAEIRDNLPFEAMLELYRDARIAPNESIKAEVNFRLMETASCGCLVLSQEVGQDQDALFVPGEEILCYSDVLELKWLIDHYLSRTDKAQAIALKGWERIEREHLVEHRARAVLDFAEELPVSAATGHEAESAFWRTVIRLRRAGKIPDTGWEAASTGLMKLPPTPDVLAELVGLWAEAGQKDLVFGLLGPILERNEHPGKLELNLACSMAGLFFDSPGTARQFLRRYLRAAGAGSSERLENPIEILSRWAIELGRKNMGSNPGFTFIPGKHLPVSAADCLALALHLKPDNPEILRRLDGLLAGARGVEHMRLGLLSDRCLREPDNWRISLGLALLNLRSFRLRQGLEELVLARDNAVRQDRQKNFIRALANQDLKGYIRNTLEALDRTGPAAS